ncbi:MAG: hypothetical protein ACI9C1_003296 [Candidatus Aldehydirespiratoraceae bacterium]
MCHDDEVSDNLEELIDELRSAVAGAPSLSQEDRDRLDGLVARVDRAADEDDHEEDEGLLDQLNDSLTRFEVENASLVSVIGRIANVLSAGGI